MGRLRKLDMRPLLKSGNTAFTVSWNEDKISVYVDHYQKLIELSYTIGGEPISEAFNITTTSCNFGKERYWILCHCGSRVCTLYLHNKHFRCRNCHNLTYKTKREPLRGKKYASLRYLDKVFQIEDLEAQLKRKTWNKIPTKKQKRIDKIARKQINNLNDFNYLESRGKRP